MHYRRFMVHGDTSVNKNVRPSLVDRLLAKTNKTADCWIWLGAKDKYGYGRIGHNGRSILAHRAAYLVATGGLPDDLKVCHRCDNPSCVRPDHLFLGTQPDNVADMMQKGRVAKGERGGQAKLMEVEVLSIKRLASKGITHLAIAERHGVSRALVSMIVSGKRWGHVSV
jgi:hypothetical protein